MAVASRRRFRWWMPVAAVLALVAAAIAVLTVMFLFREDPQAKDVGEAIEEFRRTTTTGATGVEAALRPPAGVYLLEGEGREAISFPPVHQDDGATMPATVEHLPGGCWKLKIDYNEAHWQDWRLCPTEEGLFETGGHTFQAWDFGATEVSNLSTFACDPPAAFVPVTLDAGEEVSRRCTGTNEQVPGETVASGTLTFVGVETLEIGGVDVEALHLHQRNEISGAQSGQEDGHFWFRASDALPLRGERSVRVDSDSPIGTITYTEEGFWQLRSLEPEAG